jgi:hypothetical protein
MIKGLAACSALAAAMAMAACTVHESASAPPLTGPSDYAQSITVTASPDRLPRDGQSQSSIAVRVFDATGSPAAGVAIQLDVLGVGSLIDVGTLSVQRLMTLSDGRATAVYTVPPAPPPAACDTTETVSIRAIAIGNNAQTANPFSADIRLLPAPVIVPPLDPLTAPRAAFTFFPTNPAVRDIVTFNASASSAAPGRFIVSYNWDFADGTIKSGVNVTHDFNQPGCRKVTLTVIDNAGQGGIIKLPVTVSP